MALKAARTCTEGRFSRTIAIFVSRGNCLKMSNTEPLLTKQEITELKARAHHLNPVVMVGQKGLTDAVIAETRQALHAHELIKVRVFGDDRMERIAICEALCAATGAQLVQHIGKLLVLFRRRTEDDADTEQ